MLSSRSSIMLSSKVKSVHQYWKINFGTCSIKLENYADHVQKTKPQVHDNKILEHNHLSC